YFTLQEELLKPQAQIAFKPNENIGELIQRPALPAPKQQVAQVLLTAVRPKAPARWDVEPSLQRQQQLENQIARLGGALYTYAANQRDFLEYDKAAKAWKFREKLFEEMTKAGFLNAGMLTDPLGGQWTPEGLAKLEKNFTADRLAQATNAARMYQLV